VNLKEAFDRLFFGTKGTTYEHRIVLTEFVDPLSFLKKRYELQRNLDASSKKNEESELLPYFYFRNRQTNHTYAGFGISDLVVPDINEDFLNILQHRCKNLSLQYGCKVHYFASLSFQNTTDYSWGCFPPRSFVLPKIVLIYNEITKTQEILFFEDVVHSTSNPKKEKFLETSFFIPPISSDTPQKEAFLHDFEEVQSFLQKDALHKHKKVVLALQKYVSSTKSPIDVLQKISSQEEDNFHFLYNIDGQTSFLGCSPEILCHIEKNTRENTHTIYSEALAGTVVRGTNTKEDMILADSLLHSKKDSCEHQIVIDGIVDTLQFFCSSVLYDQKPSIKKQNFVQHLCTKITAECQKEKTQHDTFSLQKLIVALHPTPAVCGYPKTDAQDIISRLEDFDRGLYAGAIGLISSHEITLCVGIRSALHHQNHYWFWGGAGLVKSSQAEAEYEEMNNKMRTFETLLKGKDQVQEQEGLQKKIHQSHERKKVN
jgi:menaquinone-specific isochorismate synthase